MFDFFRRPKPITVGDFLDALEKNGFKWTRGVMYEKETDASCAIGQATRNLWPKLRGEHQIEFQAYRLRFALDRLDSSSFLGGPGTRIIYNNDGIAREYQDVVTFAKSILAGKRDVVIPIRR